MSFEYAHLFRVLEKVTSSFLTLLKYKHKKDNEVKCVVCKIVIDAVLKII